MWEPIKRGTARRSSQGLSQPRYSWAARSFTVMHAEGVHTEGDAKLLHLTSLKSARRQRVTQVHCLVHLLGSLLHCQAVFTHTFACKYRQDIGGRTITILLHEGKPFALDAACFHFGGPLGREGDIEELDKRTCIVCPWHRRKVPLTNGNIVGAHLVLYIPFLKMAVRRLTWERAARWTPS